MSIPFSTTDLVAAVNKRRPVRTPIKDMHFSRSVLENTDSVQLDIKTGPEGIAVAISRGTKSRRAEKAGWDSLTVTIPHFSEHDLIKASDLIGVRAFGRTTVETMAMKVAEKLDDLRSKFDRTMEYMCIKAMQGQVVDGNGNVIASYSVAAPVAATVSDGTDDPIDVFDDAGTKISRALGSDPGEVVAYMGVNAYKALRTSPKVEQLLNGPAGPQMLANGEVARVGGVRIVKMPAVFIDNSGNEVPFVGDNEVIVASNQMGGMMVYGPAETPNGPLMTEYFADSWEERDPAGTMIRVETNPLPLVSRPDSIVRYTFS